MSNKLIIAIDGPAGAGKSTVARILADIFGCEYIDTGAMYRAIAYKAVQHLVDIDDDEELQELLDETEVSFKDKMILLDGKPVGSEIRTPKISSIVSRVAEKKMVREKLIEAQRKIGQEVSVVMDGRDIGTNILPHAQLKIYLTASVETRAKRRFLEQQEKGDTHTLEEIEEEIRDRDQRDMSREIAPLRQAEDAILVDSSDLSIDEVVERIKECYREVKQ